MTARLETEPAANSGKVADQRELLDQLANRVEGHSDDWHRAFVQTVADWPIDQETASDLEFHYVIGGEAFNWKRLAESIVTQLLENGLCEGMSAEMFGWIDASGAFGGLSENEFRQILGVDGWRAHLNHFYGVYIEQCLIVAVQSRIEKRRYAAGMPPSDDASDKAFMGLYEETETVLWRQFVDETSGRLDALIAHSPEGTRNIGLDEEFTYWLFKRRMENTNAAQVAAETKRGLEVMSQMRDAEDRRHRMLKDENGGALLEFGLVNITKNRPIAS